jgi:hypothetical protein
VRRRASSRRAYQSDRWLKDPEVMGIETHRRPTGPVAEACCAAACPLTGTSSGDRLKRPNTGRKGAVDASEFWPFLSKKWKSPQ